MSRFLTGVLVLTCLAVGAPVQARDAMASTQIHRLNELIVHRLWLMKDVAAWKWRNDKPIEDLAREAAVLEGASRRAGELGLDPQSVRGFISAQMEAAKAVQQRWFAVWEKDGFLRQGFEIGEPSDVDLAKVLRPAIGRTGDAILEQLALARPLLDDPEQRDMMALYLSMQTETLGLTREQSDALVEAAADVEYAANGSVLDRILTRGVLRVGTTGDYPPFSMTANSTADGFVGIDIDLAKNLGASLGVEVVFVQTSWPTLMDDFRAGQFDIGMSGITRTLARAKTAYFSDPYHSGGKAPIVRCGEETKYDTLEEINQADVRVVVNPGGTNEKFTRASVPDSQLTLFDDNRLIFGEIAKGRADVMITDRIEVDFQSNQTDGLCPATEGTFTHTKKAFLLPRDEAWRHYVNAWLDQVVSGGTLDATFNEALAGQPKKLP